MTVLFHLVCGSTGAGKTTYSTKLTQELGAVHFSIGDWMVTLFGPDAPPQPDFPWILARLERSQTQIGKMAVQLGQLGVPAVLDLGLQRQEQRQRWAGLAADAGLGLRIHFVDVDAQERWRRVTERNEQQGETYRVTVTRMMFDFIESIWQPPTPEEMAQFDGVRIPG